MKKINATPADLARVVYNKIKNLKTNSPRPTDKVLNNLFENLFYASLKTEESDFIKVTITLINEENPDPKPPKRKVKDRWNYIRFNENLPFNVQNIVKLSKAADPWSSSLAVDFNNKGELFIWGLIDQSIHYQNYLHYESDSGPEQPGLFQTSITGIGNLSVILEYDLIATLKQNILISNYLDVFKFGKISDIIRSHSQILNNEIESFLQKYPNEENELWISQVNSLWTQTLSRILIRIQNYNHGGSFVITQKTIQDFDIKHQIQYDRVYNALKNFLQSSIEYNSYSNLIFDQDNEDTLDMDLYLDESKSKRDKQESNNELKGAIRFVASLSCIDGLVILNNDLKVKGFGAVVKNIKLPEIVYISKSARINDNKLETINPNHYGTRHRAMFSYCWKHDGSIGFVVSQDGEIRAITKVEDKLILWENIKVQHLIKSRKLNRLSSINR